MIFWSSFAKKIRNAITRKEFNALKENVNDNTNNISTNSNRINGLSNDISNIGNRVNTNTNNITTNSNNINALNTTISQVNNKIDNLEQTKANKTQLDNYYTKSQSDARYLQSGNYYNKQECDSRFGTLTQQQTNTAEISRIDTFLVNAPYVNFKGEWVELDYYKEMDIVSVNGQYYASKSTNNQRFYPPNNPNFWTLISKPDDYYNKDFINDKLLNRTRTTVRTVRQAPTNFNGFWWCDFETEFYVGDNNVSNSYIEIVSCYIEGTSNSWFRVKPLKWYINGGRVGVVLFTSSNGDMNNLAVGRNVVINWFKSAYWEQPRGNISVYKE